jgi:serpin B
MASTNIELAIPKWSFDSEFELSSQLAELGMPLAFTPEADFSAMTTKTTLMISDVIHKAFVGVNEQGTEAAAATAVVMVDSGLPLPPEITFEANRPFLFFIHDQPTGAVLFLGRLVDPAS